MKWRNIEVRVGKGYKIEIVWKLFRVRIDET
jgi:hypothetical protein